MKTRVAALLLVLSVLSAGRAAAQTDSHFEAGVKAFREANYPKAAEELKQSLTAAPTANAALYLGNTYLKLGQLGAARETLNLVLKLEPNTPKREAILALIRGIDARVVGKLTITTTPPGATVYVDSPTSAARGTTPAELTIPAGRHPIIVELEGYETETREQAIKGGAKATLDIPLRAKGCSLALTAHAEGTRVSVDGAEPTAVPTTVQIKKGDHTLDFTAEGYEPEQRKVQCDGTQPLAVDVDLKQTGELTVPTIPGTVLTVDGKVVDPKSIDANGRLRLPVGRHEVTLKIGGRPEWTKIVEIKSDAPVALAPPPPPAAPPPAPPPVAPTKPAPAAPPSEGFSASSLYVGAEGGGNLVLRHWALGSGTYRLADGTHRVVPTSSAMAGVHVGYQLFSRLALEAEGHWVQLPNRVDTSHGVTYSLNVPFHVLKGSWTPIVEAGVGAYQVLSGRVGADLDPRVHAGLGLRGRLGSWLALRADVRDVITNGFNGGRANNLELFAGVEIFLRRPGR
jgi:hypothetical protein